MPSSELAAITLSSPVCSLLPEIEASWQHDSTIQTLIQNLQGSAQSGPYTWIDGIFKRKGTLIVGNNVQLKTKILQLMHNSSLGGHFGYKQLSKGLN